MKKYGIAKLLMLLAVFFCFAVASVQAEETEFDFYYQCIEKVVQVNNPEPKGWWEHAKSFVKSGVNAVKRTWASQVTNKYFPGEGSKRWYSDEDHNIAYDVKRVKVKSAAHLIQLMGASSEAELTDGQKALLAVYRHSESQAIKDRLQYSTRKTLNVILSDTTGFDDPGQYKHVQDDFWPYSNGPVIQMSSGRYNWPGSEDNAKSTFVHEFAHSFDSTIKEFVNAYGKDGSHYANELTRPRTAFVEGWAQFNEMLDSDTKIRYIKDAVTTIKIEDKKEAGEYTEVFPEDLTGQQLLSVEGINAIIMHRIATETDNGREKIFKAFTATRWKVFRSIKTITREFAKANSGDIATIGKIINEQTFGKLSDKEFIEMIGDSPEARAFLLNRSGKDTGDPEAENIRTAPSVSSDDIKVITHGDNPFSVR